MGVWGVEVRGNSSILPDSPWQMEFQNIRWEAEAEVAKIILHRPPLHILNLATLKELRTALERVQAHPRIKVLVLTGSGNKAFSAGADIRDHLPDRVDEMIQRFHEVVYALSQLEPVTLAVVNGMALGGGCELVACCDLAIAAAAAVFGQPEIKAGVFAPVASAVLPHLVGHKKAAELLLTGDAISAEEAKELGLVNQVVPFDQLEEATDAFIHRLVPKSLVVLKLAKRALIRGLKSTWKETLPPIEALYVNSLMKTHDAKEGLTAFLEKRKPVWENR